MHRSTGITSTRRLVLIAMALGAGALLALPAQGMAFKFGSKLDDSIQPSNAPLECDQLDPSASCTFIMNEAYGRPNGGEKAPRKGKITKIRLIALDDGSLTLQIARANGSGSDWQGKVVAKGPKISYQGDPDPNDDVYPVRTFKLKKPIKINEGDRIAFKTKLAQTVRCSSGGPNTLLFEPPLALGGGFKNATDTDGCWPLIEAVAKKA